MFSKPKDSRGVGVLVTVVMLVAVGVVGPGTTAGRSLQQECAIDDVDIVGPAVSGPAVDEDGDGYTSRFGFSIDLDTKCFGVYDGGTFEDGQVEPVLQIYLNDVLMGAIRNLEEYSTSSQEISDELEVEFPVDTAFLEGNFSRGTLTYRFVLLDNDPPLASLDPLTTETVDEWEGTIDYEPTSEDQPVRTDTPTEEPEPTPTEELEPTPTEEPIRPDAHIVNFVAANGSYTAGEDVVSRVEVKNVGNEFHTFFVGYGLVGPSGEAYDNNGTTGKPVSLASGEVETVFLSWTVEPRAPPGDYDVAAAVWLEGIREDLSTRLDEAVVPDAVSISSEAGPSTRQPFEVDVETTVRDGRMTLDIRVNNTADQNRDGVTLAIEGVPTNWTVANRSDAGGSWVATDRTWFWQSIEAGSNRSPSATFRIPSNATLGNRTVVLRVTDAGGANVTTTLPITPTAISRPLVVTVVDVSGNGTVEAGDEATVTFRVRNSNATKLAGVTLELDGEVATWPIRDHRETDATWSASTRTWFWRALPPNASDVVSVTLEAPADASTGVHLVTVHLTDASGHADAANVSIRVTNGVEVNRSMAPTTEDHSTGDRPSSRDDSMSSYWRHDVRDHYTRPASVSEHGRAVPRER